MDELDLRFGGPVRILAESGKDAELYGRFLGVHAHEALWFEAPPSGGNDGQTGGGFRSATKALREEGDPPVGGRRVWCLLDGEESLRFGRGCELFENSELIFTIDDPACDGMLFLGCYEKENLYLQFGEADRLIDALVSADHANQLKGPFEIGRRRSYEIARQAAVLKLAAKTTWYNPIVGRVGGSDRNIGDEIFELCDRLQYDIASFEGKRNQILNYCPVGPRRSLFHDEIDRISALIHPNYHVGQFMPKSNNRSLAFIDGKMMMEMGFGRDLSRAARDVEARMIASKFTFVFRRAMLKAIAGLSVHRSIADNRSQLVSHHAGERKIDVPGYWRLWPTL